ncbi:hypothetical protein HOM50_05010 [bacterium]|jgi:predicted NUDIX family phosphoesterase|nr:hypothetical protein [bacterium]MBT5015741.1 hypothetical protein [bacterium]
MQKTTVAQQSSSTHDEHILVIKRDLFFSITPAWDGLKDVSFDQYLQLISDKKEFLPRSVMEQDSSYKQIIPYLVFEFDNKYFLMQRSGTASEARLKNKYSLGIGGHIRQEDMQQQSIFDWARREFHEEINYTGDFEIEPLGVLNDDSNAVGQVHVGFVFLLKGNSADISIKSELKHGALKSLEECKETAENLESWSQIVLEKLINQKEV